MIRSLTLCCLAIAGRGAHQRAAPPPVSLSQSPLVMRLSKDEFRIAFGITAQHCAANGCHGLIRYRVRWKTEAGPLHSETKQVGYAVPPHYGRSIAVDRQYFDTAEGEHTTQIVKVSVDAISCHDGAQSL